MQCPYLFAWNFCLEVADLKVIFFVLNSIDVMLELDVMGEWSIEVFVC